MRITTKGRYALRAIITLARMGEKGNPVSIKTLAEAEGLSPVFLEQIFFGLRRAELVRSVRGPGGGFALAKPVASITLRQIMEAAGEGLDITPCTCGKNDECERRSTCSAESVWQALGDHMNSYLDSINLADIARQA